MLTLEFRNHCPFPSNSYFELLFLGLALFKCLRRCVKLLLVIYCQIFKLCNVQPLSDIKVSNFRFSTSESS